MNPLEFPLVIFINVWNALFSLLQSIWDMLLFLLHPIWSQVFLSSSGPAGSTWTGKLFYCQYRNDIKDRKPAVHRKLKNIPSAIAEMNDENFSGENILEKRVKRMKAFRLDLPYNLHPFFERLFSHFFIEFETFDGFAVTFEKNMTNILVQSCRCRKVISRHSKLDDRHVRRFVASSQEQLAKQRKKLATMKMIEKTLCFKKSDLTIADVFEMIEDQKQLEVDYNIVDANCQVFVRKMWNEFGSELFPEPYQHKNTRMFKDVSYSKWGLTNGKICSITFRQGQPGHAGEYRKKNTSQEGDQITILA